MILPDVNLLVYAHREETPEHQHALQWLSSLLSSSEPFGMANIVLSGFLRIVTHRKIFSPASSMIEALDFVSEIENRSNYVPVNPGPKHLQIFTELCRFPDVRGPLVADAYLAALAIEHGCEFATRDGDFGRFTPRLRVRQPF